MTVPHDLSAVIQKFRRITAQPSQSQISDQEIVNYVNTFYQFDLPMHLPLFNMKETYTFYTTPNVDGYVFPRNTYSYVQPPFYCAGYQCFYSQSREQFWRTFPKFNFFDTLATGDGITTVFNLQATQVPFLKSYINENGEVTSDFVLSSIDAGGNAIQVIDNGVLASPNSDFLSYVGTVANVGTVNWVTGAISVTFTAPPGAGQPITAQYVPYVAARPQAVLFFQDMFYLRPVPDNVYQVQVDAWRYPTPIFDPAGPTAVPQLDEWWQLLAYGAADKFFTDNADFENLARFRPIMQEQLKLINRRTIKQQASQRSSTIYSEQIQFPYNQQGYRFF